VRCGAVEVEVGWGGGAGIGLQGSGNAPPLNDPNRRFIYVNQLELRRLQSRSPDLEIERQGS
jgi:hypothetical protein